MIIKLIDVIKDNQVARKELQCTLFQLYMIEYNDCSEEVFWKRMNNKLQQMTLPAYLYFYVVNTIDNINLGIWFG